MADTLRTSGSSAEVGADPTTRQNSARPTARRRIKGIPPLGIWAVRGWDATGAELDSSSRSKRKRLSGRSAAIGLSDATGAGYLPNSRFRFPRRTLALADACAGRRPTPIVEARSARRFGAPSPSLGAAPPA